MTVTTEQIQDKTDQINLLLDGIGRPSNKQDYVRLVESLKSERDALISQKNAEDDAAREAKIQERIEYEQSNAYKLELLEGEYSEQFASLQSAYNAAIILNDETSITDIRTEYQSLLAEYNAKKELLL